MATEVADAPVSTAHGPVPSAAQRRSHRKDNLYALGFLAPQLIGLVLFMIGPLIFAFALAFVNWDGFTAMTPAGFDNFIWVFTDPQIRQSTLNTLWFTVLQMPALMISGFIAAYFLQKAGKIKSLYRLFFFAPQVVSTVAVAGIWLWLFNPEISPLNNALKGVGIIAPDWLQNPKTVILAFAIVEIGR